jgi:hypothetical protein
MPRHERGRLFRVRFDNLACDCVDQPHIVLFAVTNQRLSNFAVRPISKRVDCWHITVSRFVNTAVRLAASHRDDLRCNHFNSSRSPRRQVKHSIIHKRPAIVHSNFDRLAIAWVTDDKAGAQWESSVSSSKSVGIELFSRGCPVPPKLIAIPRSRYSIFAIFAVCTRC